MSRRDNNLAQYIKPSKGKMYADPPPSRNSEAKVLSKNPTPSSRNSETKAEATSSLPVAPHKALSKNPISPHALRQMTRYGNTLAVIQDAFVASNGSIALYMSAPIDTLPGKGPQKWLEEKQRRVEAHTKMLEANDYSWNARATCKPAHIALSKYRPFKKLYGERKFAHRHFTYPPLPASTTSAKSVTFLDLPGEIRNRIYRLALVFDEPFELVPKAGGSKRAPGRALVACKKQFAKSLGPRKVLRVNKQVNKEASDIFYGENRFCFTAVVGWQVLRGFMATIGKDNAARLRKITVHIHWPGQDTKLNDSIDKCDLHGWDFGEVLSPEEFFEIHKPLDKVRTFEEAYQECIKIFEDAGVLESLNLVLSYGFEVFGFSDLVLDLTKFKIKPKIKLIHLNASSGWTSHESQHPLRKLGPLPPLPKPARGRNRRNAAPAEPPVIEEYKNAKVYAIAKGWEYEPGLCSDKGVYTAAKDLYWGPEGMAKAIADGEGF
ncbi:hypothetical protein PRZ48_005730 [Zasmidium cellare]|uniref:Uncharacterized protein n=1 Tax=Zasmidium cellare TaxID=395010 RepID=A0ABR0EMA5_ZASCE|nr:hypothetical protein PRZ48_005730 [Zasmidium cellare]